MLMRSGQVVGMGTLGRDGPPGKRKRAWPHAKIDMRPWGREGTYWQLKLAASSRLPLPL